MLGKYFIGYLCPTPIFHSAELIDLYTGWTEYLRIAVEALTTMSFEVDTLIKDSQLWFSGGILSTHAIRKFYQLQSRLLTKTGFPVLFGTKYVYIPQATLILLTVCFRLGCKRSSSSSRSLSPTMTTLLRSRT